MLSDEEFEQVKKLWATAYLNLMKMGQIIGRHTKTVGEKMGVGGLELEAVIRRKDGTIRKTQEYKYKGKKDKEGKPIMVLKDRKIKDFARGDKIG